jgi:hypothetical protein
MDERIFLALLALAAFGGGFAGAAVAFWVGSC